MNEYILFLDESGVNPGNEYFCLGGFIISRQTYENKIIKEVETLKTNHSIPHEVPLHYTDIKNSKGYFSIFKSKNGDAKRSALLLDVVKLIHDSDLTTIGCYCHKNNFEAQFQTYSRCDLYGIMLKKIMEQYIMFLLENNATGSIYIESRTFNEDNMLHDIFNSYLEHGSEIFSPKTIKNTLKTITFVIKRDVSSGVQLADFVPIGFLRKINGLKDNYNLSQTIYSKLYKNGTIYKNSLGLVNYLHLDK